MRNYIYIVSKHIPTKQLNYKGEKSYFTTVNTDRHPLNQLIKMIIWVKGHIKSMCHLTGYNENIASQLASHHNQTSDKCKLRYAL